MSGRLLAAAVCALALTLCRPAFTRAQAAIEILPVQGAVSMLAGAGGNITLQVGDQGILMVDTGRTDAVEPVLAAVRAFSPKPIHYIINTSGDADHTGGNDALSRAGRPAPGSNQAASPGAPIYAHENVLNRMSAPTGQTPSLPFSFWPTVTFFTAKRTLWFNDDPIELLWQKNAHSDGDVMVFFRRSDVLSTGDVFDTTAYPTIDTTRGGSIQGAIDAVNRIIDITIPRMNQIGGTRVIPGHGRICNEADVVEYRDMVTIVRDRVKDLADKGMTLEQIQAARPTYEYDPLYGADSGRWTTKMFVEAIYKTLPKPDPALKGR